MCSTEKPFQPSLIAPSSPASFAASASDRRAVRPRQRALPDDDQRPLRPCRALREIALAGRELAERLRPGAEIVVGIGQVDAARRSAPIGKLPGAPALADARVEHRRFLARIGADDQQRVGLLDAGDGRVEQVARAAERRIERRAVLPAVDVRRRRARAIRSLSANISSTAARSPAIAPMRSRLRALHLGGDRGERLASTIAGRSRPSSRT